MQRQWPSFARNIMWVIRLDIYSLQTIFIVAIEEEEDSRKLDNKFILKDPKNIDY